MSFWPSCEQGMCVCVDIRTIWTASDLELLSTYASYIRQYNHLGPVSPLLHPAANDSASYTVNS